MVELAFKQQREQQEATLRIQGLAFKGFRIIVGKSKGSGLFEYFKGTRTNALKRAKVMLKETEKMISQDCVITLEPCWLKKCNIKYCERLCESNEPYCLRCEDILWDTQLDIDCERLKNEQRT